MAKKERGSLPRRVVFPAQRSVRDELLVRVARYRVALEQAARLCTMGLNDPSVNLQGQRYLRRLLAVLIEVLPAGWDSADVLALWDMEHKEEKTDG